MIEKKYNSYLLAGLIISGIIITLTIIGMF